MDAEVIDKVRVIVRLKSNGLRRARGNMEFARARVIWRQGWKHTSHHPSDVVVAFRF